MIYQFQADDGRIVERTMPASRAPEIGSRCEFEVDNEQVRVVRILSTPAAVRGDPWKPYVSHRLPRFLKDQPCTSDGKPIVSTRSQEREIMARFGYERE